MCVASVQAGAAAASRASVLEGRATGIAVFSNFDAGEADDANGISNEFWDARNKKAVRCLVDGRTVFSTKVVKGTDGFLVAEFREGADNNKYN